MTEPRDTAARYIEPGMSLTALRRKAKTCTACELHERGTQTVFGDGVVKAAILLVGEQPGDAEDRAGKPFVGPAGKLLDKALAEAGIERGKVYVTNVVKHFRWVARGKKRIHQKPKAIHIDACLPWLEGEIERVEPEVVVALGATAAQALFGSAFRVTKQRGKRQSSRYAPASFATVHPSSLLRAPDDETRHREYARFVEDLRAVADAARSVTPRRG
jgi:DNA polymerase